MKTLSSEAALGRCLLFGPLAALGLPHAVTTRGALGHADFNLGNANQPAAGRYWDELSRGLFGGRRIVFPHQVSGGDIWIVGADADIDAHPTGATADAVVTSRADIALAIKTADCVPVLLYAPEAGALALAHAGWRGTATRIAARAALALRDAFGADPAQIRAAIGPAIGPGAYEVGPEVIEAMRRAQVPPSCWRPAAGGKAMLDLAQANALQLGQAGLAVAHIHTCGICTYADTRFYSARRDGAATGRFATVAALPIPERQPTPEAGVKSY